MTLREKIGQRLVGGFPGKEISPEFVRLVEEYKVGNVILFRHNIESGSQLKALCRQIQALVREHTGHSAFICIDQEGGGVSRLPEDGVNVPGGMALAATGSPENARLAAAITARELRALGIQVNFAPVADVNNNPRNPIIGSRCFGDTPQQVCAFLLPALEGYRESGVLATVKHFPGHGDTQMDSHISLPVIPKTLEQLEQLELIPFRAAVEAGCPLVMTTHILFPGIEKEHVPATMSRAIITGLLKQKLGFRGLVVSDCMEMAAIQTYYGTARGAAAAAAAGVDLITVSHTESLAAQAAEEMEKAVLSGRISMEEMDASVEKILAYKARWCSEPQGEFGTPEAFAQARALRAASIAAIGAPVPPLGDRPLFAGCADYRSGLVSNAEESRITFPDFMARHLGGDALVTGTDPDAREIEAAAAAARGHSALVVCTYNGHLHPGQLALVKALGQTGLPLIQVALRDPYDLKALPAGGTGIAAWDYSLMTLEVLVPVLSGERKASGGMPVKL